MRPARVRNGTQPSAYSSVELMSALPPKADMCSAQADVRFVPIADIAPLLLDHLVRAGEQRGRHGEAKRLGGLEIDGELKFGRLRDR